MLRESLRIRQHTGQPRRRWFFNSYFDLVVWVSDDGRFVGFHLLYDRTGDEKIVTWNEGSPVRHYGVDDGDRSGRMKMSAVLAAPVAANSNTVADRFERESREIEPAVAAFVLDQLRTNTPARPTGPSAQPA